jgi:hypothetical protein
MNTRDQHQTERKKRQAQARRDRKRAAQLARQQNAAIEAAQNEDPQPQREEQTETATITNFDQATEPAALAECDKRWQGCCRLAVNLLRSNQIAQFVTDLHGDRVPQVTEPAMMTAAISLVSGMSAAGVKRWDWLPAPTAEELADPAAWAERRLAERRVVQDEAERIRRQQQKVARAFGQPRSGGSGTINPVYLQQSKHSLEELVRRLEQAARRAGFRREHLDHRSPNYLSVAKGGISNKQITIMACMIAGQARRSFDESWNIVTEFLRKHRAEQS